MARQTLTLLRAGKRVGYVTSAVERGDDFRKVLLAMGATPDELRRVDVVLDVDAPP